MAEPAIRFFDCTRVGPGKTLVCSVQWRGRAIRGRFDPSPLAYGEGYLIPIKRGGWLGQRYALAYLAPEAATARVVSRSRHYMRLIGVDGTRLTYAPDVDGKKTRVLDVAL